MTKTEYKRYIASGDLASKNDLTAISVFHIENGVIVIDKSELVRPKNALEMYNELLKHYNAIDIERFKINS